MDKWRSYCSGIGICLILIAVIGICALHDQIYMWSLGDICSPVNRNGCNRNASRCAGLRTAGGQLHLTVQDANEHLFIHLVHRFFSSRAGELTLQQCTRSPAERPWAACPPAPRCARGRAAQNTRRTPCSSLQNR